MTQKTDESMIDMKQIQSIFGQDTSSLKKYFSYVVSETSALINEIQDAINAQNCELSKELFHSLKGSAGLSGILQIPELCVRAQETSLQGDWEATRKIHASIQAVFKQFQAEVESKY